MFRVTDQRHSDAMIAATGARHPDPLSRRDATSIAIRAACGSRGTWTGCSRPASRCACAPATGENHDEARAALRAGLDDLRFVELDDSRPANSQQEHNYFTTKNVDLHLVPGSVRSKVEQLQPVRHRRIDAVRAAAARTSRQNVSIANGAVGVATDRTDTEVVRRAVGARLRRLLGTSPNPPLFAANQALRTERDDIAEPELHAADARRRHHLLLEDRVEDRREPDPAPATYVELHDGRSTAAATTAAHRRDDARSVGIEHAERPTCTATRTRLTDRDRIRRRGAVAIPTSAQSKISPALAIAGQLLRADVHRLPRHRVSPVGAPASRSELARQRFGARAVQRLDRFARVTATGGSVPTSSAEVVLQSRLRAITSDSGWGWADDGWDAPGDTDLLCRGWGPDRARPAA